LDDDGVTHGIIVSDQTNTDATPDDVPGCTAVSDTGVWYILTARLPVIVTVSTCHFADFPAQATVFTGACGSLECETPNDGSTGCESTTRIIGNAAESKDIYIFVNGRSAGQTGNFELSVVVKDLVPPVSFRYKTRTFRKEAIC